MNDKSCFFYPFKNLRFAYKRTWSSWPNRLHSRQHRSLKDLQQFHQCSAQLAQPVYLSVPFQDSKNSRSAIWSSALKTKNYPPVAWGIVPSELVRFNKCQKTFSQSWLFCSSFRQPQNPPYFTRPENHWAQSGPRLSIQIKQIWMVCKFAKKFQTLRIG